VEERFRAPGSRRIGGRLLRLLPILEIGNVDADPGETHEDREADGNQR
jgi:hypothetical protein